MIPVRVFTHPTCATCPNAIRLAQKLAEENSAVDLRIISLGSASGRVIAKSEQVLSVPTVLVGSTRFVGVPEWGQLVEAVREAGEEQTGKQVDR